MNWVGGSRNRLVMKNDAKKQREFFERINMQKRLEKLGITLPNSSTPGNVGCGNTDLMTLFIVNQIATKKENKDPPKVSFFGKFKGGTRDRRNKPLVLPMSPCSPSQLSLVGSPSPCRVQEIRKRKNVFPHKHKCRQLSPVVESAFSDNSASDYLPPVTVPCSPASSGSSGQGMFPLQMNLQNQRQIQMQLLPCYSPPPWDTSVLHQSQFQLFSQPREITDSVSWSCKSNPLPFQLETPTAAQVLFGSPELENCELKNGGADTFFLHQPEESLNIPLNLPETEHPFEEDVFMEFGAEDYEAEGFGDENPKSKIYLMDEASVRSSTPQTVPAAQNSGAELSNVNSPRLHQNTGLLKGSEFSPSCSCKAGFLSSDSSDDESGCEQCLQASAFYTNEARSQDNIKTSQKSPNVSEPGPHTPALGSKINPGDEQIIVDQTSASPSSPWVQTLCKCKKNPTKTQESGTQTTLSCPPETCDASTQCESDAAGFSSQRPTAAAGSEQSPASETEPEPQGSTTGEKWPPLNPLQSVFNSRGEDEGSPRVNEASDGGTEEVRGHRLSEDAEMLQEIADILVLLKQRRKVDRLTYRK